jgi:hypothetical protein
VLADIVDAPPTPSVSIDPANQWFLIMESPNLPPLSELAERELRLGGMRFKPQTNGPSRTRPYTGLKLMRLADGEGKSIAGLPDGARIENVRWSPDGSHIAFTHTTDRGISAQED